MLKRFSLTIVMASLLMLTSSESFAGWRHRKCCCYYPATTVVQQAAPTTPMPTVAEAPPTAPAEGETTQSPSIEPAGTPVQGTTVRSYSVQPATNYQSATPSSIRNPIERRLHPGRGFYRD